MRSFNPHSRSCWLVPVLSVFLVNCASTPASSQSSAVTLTPTIVEAGAPVLVQVEAADAASLNGDWLGRKLAFFLGRGGHTWYALAGVDVEAPTGPSALRINLRFGNGGVRDLTRSVEIHPAHYRTGSLS